MLANVKSVSVGMKRPNAMKVVEVALTNLAVELLMIRMRSDRDSSVVACALLTGKHKLKPTDKPWLMGLER